MNHLEKAATSLITGAIAAAVADEGEKAKRTAGAVLGDTIGGFTALGAVAPSIYNETKNPMEAIDQYAKSMWKRPNVFGITEKKDQRITANVLKDLFEKGHFRLKDLPDATWGDRLISKLKHLGRMGKNPKGLAALLGGSAVGGLIGYHAV